MAPLPDRNILFRFPQSADNLYLHALPGILSDLNALYELVAISILPGYELVPFPERVLTRRTSRLLEDDRLRTGRLAYGSELEVAVWVAGAATTAWTAAKTLPTMLNGTREAIEGILDRPLRRERQELEVESLQLDVLRKRAELAAFLREEAERERRALDYTESVAAAPRTPITPSDVVLSVRQRLLDAVGGEVKVRVHEGRRRRRGE